MTQQTFTVTVTREGPWWVAVVDGVRGSAVETRRLQDLEDEVRDGLALLLDVDAQDLKLTWHYELPDDSAEALRIYRQARACREEAERTYEESLRRVAVSLEKAHVSVRDTATLMGVSHQYVQQLRNKDRKSA
jgi:hypothetical protein